VTYVRFERRGAAAWATLARQDRANALGPEIVEALAEWVRAAEEDTSISALVITGEGRAFCPGADVKASLEMAHEPDRRAAFFDETRGMLDRLSGAPIPVIAAVNGVAYAGGLELALACDFIIAAQSASFGDLHLAHGRIPAWGSSARLLNALGPWRSTRLLLDPSPVSAEELRELGVVALVVDDANLLQAVDEVVGRLAGYQPDALRAMKALIAEQRGHSLKPLLEVEAAHFRRFLAGGHMHNFRHDLARKGRDGC
jgi:enoyl-CoA hydratase/carnithine racemase